MIITSPSVNSLLNPQTLAADWPGGFWWHWVLFTIIVIAVVIVMVMGYIYMARRQIGRMQSRVGPNRTGPFGLLQPIADVLKVLLKEGITPTNVDKTVYWLAPIVGLFPVFSIFAVMPFTNGGMLANLNVGILYVVAISSISTVGMFMAGWSSSNKFSLISAMRVVAAVVSYEIPVLLSIAGVLLLSGSLSMNDIVLAQDIPFILLQPLGFIVFFIAGLAEISRSPFDLLEADSEIVAGFHIEYSGIKFALFYLVEYGEAFLLSCLISTLFLGGWRGPWLPEWMWFIAKGVLVWFVMVWLWATLPRVRIDQMMALAWKFLLPLALINLVVTAIQVLTLPEGSLWVMIPVNFVITAVLILLWSKNSKLGWGRVEV
ncbi:MAG: NADH-quinone oxidoreductase subunit NuoH [Dehalococcoidales bacterium]|nr:NADH-quinone oxidoreductase subunit NuoH [Dehalococcoidales bacterium]